MDVPGRRVSSNGSSSASARRSDFLPAGSTGKQSRHRLKEEAGGAKKLLAEMKNALVTRKLRGTVLENLEDAIGYFENHLPKMNYARFRKECLPIGSGVTEAACKTVVKQRLCGSGMKWKQSGASAVLRLRSLILTEGR